LSQNQLVETSCWFESGQGRQRFALISDDAVDETDGAELTLYVWREFCENPNPPPISGPPIRELVSPARLFMLGARAPTNDLSMMRPEALA
jgi:hypothetical protein